MPVVGSEDVSRLQELIQVVDVGSDPLLTFVAGGGSFGCGGSGGSRCVCSVDVW